MGDTLQRGTPQKQALQNVQILSLWRGRAQSRASRGAKVEGWLWSVNTTPDGHEGGLALEGKHHSGGAGGPSVRYLPSGGLCFRCRPSTLLSTPSARARAFPRKDGLRLDQRYCFSSCKDTTANMFESCMNSPWPHLIDTLLSKTCHEKTYMHVTCGAINFRKGYLNLLTNASLCMKKSKPEEKK